MDNIDKKILHLLQENARYPLKHLASKVFLYKHGARSKTETGILPVYPSMSERFGV